MGGDNVMNAEGKPAPDNARAAKETAGDAGAAKAGASASTNETPRVTGGAARATTGTNQTAKVEALQPHAVSDQFAGIEYCIKSPPSWSQSIILGFQHYLIILGQIVFLPSVLVPLMGGNHRDTAEVIQTTLLVTALNTLSQTLVGSRLPVIVGACNTYLIPMLSIIGSHKYQSIEDPHERFLHTMRGIQGSLLFASILQFCLGAMGGWAFIVRDFLSPLSCAPIIILATLGSYQVGFPRVAKCIEIGLPEVILLLFFSQFAKHVIPTKTWIYARFGVILSVAVVWLYAEFLTAGGAYNDAPISTQYHCRTDRSGLVSSAPWFMIPHPARWGRIQFQWGQAVAMTAASFPSLVESTGMYFAASRSSGATPIPPGILGRGIAWQGIGIFLNGLFGTVTGSAPSMENIGLIGMTGVASRRVILLSTGYMFFFSIFDVSFCYAMANRFDDGNTGKFGAILASIPAPIVAAACFRKGLIGNVIMATTAGEGFTLLQFCNLNSGRTMFILGFSMFLGLSIPQYFNEFTISSGHGPVHTDEQWFNDMINVMFGSPAAVGGLVAIILDCILDAKGSATKKDGGWHWWRKFRSYATDPRSEEYYGWPFKIRRFTPSH